MARLTAIVLAAATAAAVDVSAAPVQVSGDCRLIRLTADGRRFETPPGKAAVRGTGRAASSAVSASSAGGRSRSTVSASSSTRGGRSGAVSTASTTDADGRTITTTHDRTGCTVVIDERSARGGIR